MADFTLFLSNSIFYVKIGVNQLSIDYMYTFNIYGNITTVIVTVAYNTSA